MLTVSGKHCQNGMKYGHFTIENLPYMQLYLSPGSKRLEPASKYSDLIGTKLAFNYLYLDRYFSHRAAGADLEKILTALQMGVALK